MLVTIPPRDRQGGGGFDPAFGCGPCTQEQCDAAVGTFLLAATMDSNETSICEWVYQFPASPGGQGPLRLTFRLVCSAVGTQAQVNLEFPRAEDTSGESGGSIVWFTSALPGEGEVDSRFENLMLDFSGQESTLACIHNAGDPRPVWVNWYGSDADPPA